MCFVLAWQTFGGRPCSGDSEESNFCNTQGCRGPSSDPVATQRPEISAAQVRATASGLSGQNGALVHQPFSILSASFSHLWPFCTFFVPVVTWLLTSLDISCCQNLSDTGPNAPRSVEVVKSNDFEILPFQGALLPSFHLCHCRVKISLKRRVSPGVSLGVMFVSCLCHVCVTYALNKSK